MLHKYSVMFLSFLQVLMCFPAEGKLGQVQINSHKVRVLASKSVLTI